MFVRNDASPQRSLTKRTILMIKAYVESKEDVEFGTENNLVSYSDVV